LYFVDKTLRHYDVGYIVFLLELGSFTNLIIFFDV